MCERPAFCYRDQAAESPSALFVGKSNIRALKGLSSIATGCEKLTATGYAKPQPASHEGASYSSIGVCTDGVGSSLSWSLCTHSVMCVRAIRIRGLSRLSLWTSSQCRRSAPEMGRLGEPAAPRSPRGSTLGTPGRHHGPQPPQPPRGCSSALLRVRGTPGQSTIRLGHLLIVIELGDDVVAGAPAISVQIAVGREIAGAGIKPESDVADAAYDEVMLLGQPSGAPRCRPRASIG